MKLNEIKIIEHGPFVLAYKDNGSNFCTETFDWDSEWYNRIISEYGDVEIISIRPEKWASIVTMIFIDKESCFKISREIMNTYMVEDNSWEEIA